MTCAFPFVGSQAPNVSILAHVLGKAPLTAGSYLMRNRIIGQVDASQTTTCSDARCAGTLRPPGCVCTKGADDGAAGYYLLLPVSNQVRGLQCGEYIVDILGPIHALCLHVCCERLSSLFPL